MDKLTFGEQIMWLGAIGGVLAVSAGCWMIHYILGVIVFGIAVIVLSALFNMFWSDEVEGRR